MTATTTALLVALSLVGCATDNDGEGGGYLAGLRPAKPSLDDQKSPVIGLNPAIEHVLTGGLAMKIHGGTSRTRDGGEISAETIQTPFPIDGLCHSCEVVVLRDARNPGELNVIDDFGRFFCRIWITESGTIESTDCR